MRERLLKFIEIEKLTASRLAEILGVQPATISHLLNGRNKPSFEFIEKMLQRFPKLNPEWLLLGKGTLYRTEILAQTTQAQSLTAESSTGTLFAATLHAESSADQQSKESVVHPSSATAENSSSAIRRQTSKTETAADLPDSDIERIVIFLKNGTYIAYKPQ